MWDRAQRENKPPSCAMILDGKELMERASVFEHEARQPRYLPRGLGASEHRRLGG